MENRRTWEFSEAARAPAVLAVVLEAWLRLASAPGDLIDVLVAAATADLVAGTFGDHDASLSDPALQPDGADGLKTFETSN